MNKKNKSLIKNIGLFTIGSFGSKILSFLLVPLYTAVLTTTEYGSVDLITSTASLLTPILLLSMMQLLDLEWILITKKKMFFQHQSMLQ